MNISLTIIDKDDRRDWSTCQVAHNRWVIPANPEFHRPAPIETTEFAVGDSVRLPSGEVVVVASVDGGMVYFTREEFAHCSQLTLVARPAKEAM